MKIDITLKNQYPITVDIEEVNEESDILAPGYARIYTEISLKDGRVNHLFSYNSKQKVKHMIRAMLHSCAKNNEEVEEMARNIQVHHGAVHLKNIKVY